MKENKTGLHPSAEPKRCDVALDPEDMPLYNFGEDSGATDIWWE